MDPMYPDMAPHTYACRGAKVFPKACRGRLAAAVIVANVGGSACQARLRAVCIASRVRGLLTDACALCTLQRGALDRWA